MSTQTIFVRAGQQNVSTDIALVQNAAATSPGDAKTALAFGDMTAYYCVSPIGTLTAISVVTQTVGGAWSSGGFIKRSDANAPGGYRFDVPNAVIPTNLGGEANIWFQASGTATHQLKIVASAATDGPLLKRRSTLQAATSNTATLDASATTANCQYGDLHYVESGTGAGNSNIVLSFDNATKIATYIQNWATSPGNPSTGSVVTCFASGGLAPLIAQLSASGKLKVDTEEFLGQQMSLTGIASDNTGKYTT